MKVLLKDGTEIETDNLSTTTEIQSVIDDLRSQIDKMESDLLRAEHVARSRHKYANGEWYTTTKYVTKRYKYVVQQLISKKAAVRRDEERLERAQRGDAEKRHKLSFDRHFVMIAREKLTGELFAAICSEAESRATAEQESPA